MAFFIPTGATPCNDTFSVLVTPQIAYEWLKSNSSNRPIKRGRVAEYAGTLQRGEWRKTHQSIAFSTEKALLDGQHRLAAIVESGVSVLMRVVVDQDADNFTVIDCGKTRNDLDTIRINMKSDTITSAHTHTLKSMLAGRFCKTANRWTNVEINELYEEHKESVNFVVAQFLQCKNKSINDPTVRGVIARASFSVPDDCLVKFCAELTHPGTVNTKSINTLKNFLSIALDRKMNTKREIYRRTNATLHAFIIGQAVPDIFSDDFQIPVFTNKQ